MDHLFVLACPSPIPNRSLSVGLYHSIKVERARLFFCNSARDRGLTEVFPRNNERSTRCIYRSSKFTVPELRSSCDINILEYTFASKGWRSGPPIEEGFRG